MRIVPGAAAAALLAAVLASGHGACGGGGGPTPPSGTTTTTTSTTTSSTTSTTSTTTSTTSTTSTSTTSTTTPTTTTTTTTTTMPPGYAIVHPLWTSRGCTGCHTGGNRLNLSGSASATCAVVRNGQDAANGQYLDNPTCSANGSSILTVPTTGQRPGGAAHPGGADGCFAAGGTCRRDILAWCTGGAAC